MNLTSLQTLLVDELQDIYDAENRIVSALPRMAQAASEPKLKNAFNEHLEESRGHIQRLNKVMSALGVAPSGTTCEAARGLIAEGEKVMDASGNPSVKDAALIGAAQRVEHYEMAAYGTACALAKQLDLAEEADLLHQTLEEEKSADERLTKLATGGILSSGINAEAESATRYQR
jgi:ferritin-like metal-binding protein YciE